MSNFTQMHNDYLDPDKYGLFDEEPNGCDTCAKHWNMSINDDLLLRLRDEIGFIPVWTDCPDCGGYGAVI